MSGGGYSISDGGFGPGDWQLFGDGVDLTLSVTSGQSFLFPRIIIAGWNLQIEQDFIDDGRMRGWKDVVVGSRSARLRLDIVPSGKVTLCTNGELWIPDRQIKQLSITDLFGIINQKIDER